MFNNVQDDKQLSLNFEFSQAEESPAQTISAPTAMSVRSHLELVVNNRSNGSRLSPDSVEITRILAGQAKMLGW
jgi:hypothetical protein